MRGSLEPSSPLKAAVEHAVAQPQVLEAVDRMYEQIRDETAARRPVCEMSGRCCNFEVYGHRMYVSTIELAAFVAGLRGQLPTGRSWDGSGCPFQVVKVCRVHTIRPMGCRVFFCDPTAGEWQNDLYERLHQQFRQLHEQFNVPYFYVEWREGLRQMGLADRLTVVGGAKSF